MKELLNAIKKKYGLKKVVKQRDDLFFVTVPKSYAVDFITHMKDYEKFTHLAFLNAVDRLEKNLFQLTYLLDNPTSNISLGIRVEVSRTEPEMTTIHHLWNQVAAYERELKEMFGIRFPGSPRQHESFVLEGWQEIPPMRRDFDTLKYSNETFFPRPGRQTHDPKEYMKEKLYPDFFKKEKEETDER
ncbi:MAG: NADH-quinone oxidoreductase subunit C [Candidatus Cloacimonetes bacterium]|nr:NADH-quinone oxidoreductase subunit C [Candidatus Cloacimonadota bacterium]MCF7813519.1 NADH-quinone oxidoreductase subunit C [Candidatus Cloacimonadota bacterium]MCF7868697.1 NADH-quinone oxidoreductase subunit C [Candidatus Cloacimonadota bacterium]MCF7884663.1 NADH-quinone oxidoreductase subunit C [Candidatus Cloacimonadota bacterium]